MYQMPNIWHICHTKHKKHQISDGLNLIFFATCEQYRCKFATVWNRYGISFNPFFILFSLSSLFTFLFSLLSHSSLDITPFHSFLLSLFFLLNLVVFLSSSQTSPSVFSSHSFLRSLRSLSLWYFFFFGSDLIAGSVVGGLRWWLADHWWWVVMVRFSGGWVGWWWVLLCEIGGAKSVNGFIKTRLGNWIAYQLIVGANLAFNMIKQTIGWTDWAKAAIMPGLVVVRWWLLVVGSSVWVVNIILMCRKYYFNV